MPLGSLALLAQCQHLTRALPVIALLLAVWTLRDVRDLVTTFLWEDRTTVYVASLSANCWGALRAEAQLIVMDYRWYVDVLLEQDFAEYLDNALQEEVRALMDAGEIW